MDALKLNQLAALYANQGAAAATFNPVQKAELEGLHSSTQGTISALAQEKAAKEAKKKKGKGIGKAVGTAAAIAAAPFTGGASLTYLPMAATAGGGIDSMLAGDTVKGATDIAMAGAGGYAAYTDPVGNGRMSIDKSTSKMLDTTVAPLPPASPAPAPSLTPNGIMPSTQGTPAPQAPPVQATPLPPQVKATQSPVPGAPKSAAPTPEATPAGKPGPFDLFSSNFDVPTAALTGLAAYGGMQAAKPTPKEQPTGNAAAQSKGRPSARKEAPTKPITEEEARKQGYDPEQIKVFREQGLITGPGRGDALMAGAVGLAAGLLPHLLKGQKNA